jgi:hypothetical protein
MVDRALMNEGGGGTIERHDRSPVAPPRSEWTWDLLLVARKFKPLEPPAA